MAKRWACAVVLGLSTAFTPAFGATFSVTKTSDTLDGACDADCSLREAIAAANARPGSDTILLQAAFYRLTRTTPRDPSNDDSTWPDEDGNVHGDFDVTDDVVIKGKGSTTAVDAGHLERVFEILPGVTAEFRDFRIQRGHERTRGAGVANAGTLKLVRMRLLLNRASSSFNFGQGGAVFNAGTLSIADSHVLDNAALGGEGSSGEGAGIYNTGRLNVRATRFVGNHTSDDNDIGGGGAIMNRGAGAFATVDRSFFEKNATSSNGHGGAIANRDGARLKLVNSTVSNNESGEPPGGGGAVANGTVYGEAGSLWLNFVTIADNDGGGVFNAGDFTYYDSIIVGNYEDYGGTERHYNVGANCVSRTFPVTAGSIVATDGDGCRGQTYVDNAAGLTEVLHPLANNGGFAPTHALRDFAPAYDSASLGGGACPPTDQRGAMRPADGDADGVAACDIGAFERNHDD